MLLKVKSILILGRQEDAEEFLGFLLEGVHEELLLIEKPKIKENEWTGSFL
jgi:hypothetical protein